MDFALIMFIALLVTGVIWGLDRMLGTPARQRKAQALKSAGGSDEAVSQLLREPVLVEYARAFFPVILIVFLLRAFLVEPFRIPSGSMLPSLLPGDFILVNKFAYGIRLPVLNLKVIDVTEPERGDVMVFRYPGDTSVNYIKRVVGLPGDKIVYQDKKLYINGKMMEQRYLGDYVYPASGNGGTSFRRLTERLDGVTHQILLTGDGDGPSGSGMKMPSNRLEFEVPKDRYFVMGDNRDRSNDSRYWGYVPEENLVGKAFFIWFSWDMGRDSGWFWEKIIWNRMGNTIN